MATRRHLDSSVLLEVVLLSEFLRHAMLLLFCFSVTSCQRFVLVRGLIAAGVIAGRVGLYFCRENGNRTIAVPSEHGDASQQKS